MEKTKLGISTALTAAILYCLGLFSGISVLTFAAIAYVLIKEEDKWLKKAAVRVAVLLFVFPLINVALGFVPDVLEVINQTLYIFSSGFDDSIVSDIVNIIKNIFYILKYILYILLAIAALLHKDSKVPVVDSVIDKNND